MQTYSVIFLFQSLLFTADAQGRIATALSWTPVIQYMHVLLKPSVETPHMAALLSLITKSFIAVYQRSLEKPSAVKLIYATAKAFLRSLISQVSVI